MSDLREDINEKEKQAETPMKVSHSLGLLCCCRGKTHTCLSLCPVDVLSPVAHHFPWTCMYL